MLGLEKSGVLKGLYMEVNGNSFLAAKARVGCSNSESDHGPPPGWAQRPGWLQRKCMTPHKVLSPFSYPWSFWPGWRRP